ncbi:glycoside hydrolase family 43 protein [Athelia psychrophila]|uniref:Glycoside hydrolase family 43 protein n=1 Tax=Athelia psychrophila TaxID=1759441 RepID=A0A166D6P2_9AGAM|nr:glycoside hydrolase family 43 protein [Fibularhizoctonia sp. CBS 109695]
MRSYRLLLLCVVGLLSLSCRAFENPIKTVDGSDPFMVYQDGYYYLTTTTWSNIQISRGAASDLNLQDLKTATPKVIYSDTTASRCCNVCKWAPEIHWKSVEGAWYILLSFYLHRMHRYYVAGSASTLDDQRIYTLKSSTTDIWASTWSYAGRIVIPNNDDWAIDPTVLILSSGEYLVYSSFVGAYQCLWIAEFITATTVGNAYEISCPAYSWEEVGGNVEEGPAPLYHGGKTWLTFSASSCATSSYSLGKLELTGSSPLSASSWYVPHSQEPGGHTGHNGFFLSPSADEVWLVYHYSTSSAVACDGTRRTAVQPITFSSAGEPVFGTPDALTTELVEPV